MTLNTTHVRGKGGYNGWMTLKLSRCVRVRSLHMCAKFRGSTTWSCRENPDWGGFDFVMMGISAKFHLSFLEFKFCFSTSTFWIEFLCLLMTGANIDHLVWGVTKICLKLRPGIEKEIYVFVENSISNQALFSRRIFDWGKKPDY